MQQLGIWGQLIRPTKQSVFAIRVLNSLIFTRQFILTHSWSHRKIQNQKLNLILLAIQWSIWNTIETAFSKLTKYLKVINFKHGKLKSTRFIWRLNAVFSQVKKFTATDDLKATFAELKETVFVRRVYEKYGNNFSGN